MCATALFIHYNAFFKIGVLDNTVFDGVYFSDILKLFERPQVSDIIVGNGKRFKHRQVFHKINAFYLVGAHSRSY